MVPELPNNNQNMKEMPDNQTACNERDRQNVNADSLDSNSASNTRISADIQAKTQEVNFN